MFKTTIKGLLGHKGRLVMTLLSIVIGVGFMAGTLVFTDTVAKTFDDLWSSTSKGIDAYVRSTSTVKAQGPGDEQRALIDESVLAPVKKVDGVAAAEGSVSGYAQLVDKKGKAIGDPGQGAPTLGMNWSATPQLNAYTLVDGTAPTGDQVAIDKASADKGPYQKGDKVRVLTQAGSTELTVSGIVKFGDADSPLGASITLMDTPTAQKLVGQPGKFSAIAAVAADGVSQQTLVDRIQPVLPRDAQVITGEAYIKETQNNFRDQFAFFNTFLVVFALIALFVGAFYIYNTFSIIVTQRSKEMALLRAVGATRGQMVRSVLLEAMVVGVIGALLGLGFGVIMSGGLRGMMKGLGFDIPATGTVIVPKNMIIAFALGLVITIVSAVFPALRASRVPPIAALRDVALDRSNTSKGRVVGGVVVTGLGLAMVLLGLFGGAGVAAVGFGAAVTFIGVAVLGPIFARPVAGVLGLPARWIHGTTGGLARQNAMRNPKRTSSTAAALMIGVGLVGCVAILAASLKTSFAGTIDNNFRSDLVVDSGGFGGGGSGFSPELAAQLRKLPELKTVSELRMGGVEVNGEPQFVIAVDPKTIDSVVNVGVTQGSTADLGDSGIGMYSKLATEKGLKLGDTVKVKFAQTGEKPFKIVALYDRKDIGGDYSLGLPGLEANTTQQLDYQIFTKVADGTSIAQARTAVEAAIKDYPNGTVQDIAEYKAKQLAPFDQILGLVYTMLMLAIVIALLGIATTLGLSIFERTRELGLLRAVGMSRSQMRSTVRWESVIIALFGTLLGLVVGAVFGVAIVYALRDEGVAGVTVPFGQLAVVTFIAAVFGVIAAIWPARRASRLDVLKALAAE